MRLAAKLVSAVLVVIAIFLVIDTYFLVRRETELLESDIRNDSIAKGRFISSAISKVFSTSDPERVDSLLHELQLESDLGFRIHWLDSFPESLDE